jgi:cytochrome c55X
VRAALLTAALLLGAGPAAAAPAGAEDPAAAIRAQVDDGRAAFATACATCHGGTGMGGTGPALAGRDLPLSLIRQTVMNGRPGTPMPAFKEALDTDTQAQILAYVLWLTSNGREPTELVAGQANAPSPATETRPVAVGRDSGIPALGAQLFFDPTRLDSCRICHSYDAKGGPVGPDLIGLGETPLDVYRRLTGPELTAPGYPAVAVTLRDGTRLRGIRVEETADALAFFDLTALPPVERTIPRSKIAEISATLEAGVYDHTALRLSRQDLLDLSAFLGKPTAPSP